MGHWQVENRTLLQHKCPPALCMPRCIRTLFLSSADCDSHRARLDLLRSLSAMSSSFHVRRIRDAIKHQQTFQSHMSASVDPRHDIDIDSTKKSPRTTTNESRSTLVLFSKYLCISQMIIEKGRETTISTTFMTLDTNPTNPKHTRIHVLTHTLNSLQLVRMMYADQWSREK